jgi:hypothetical protein
MKILPLGRRGFVALAGNAVDARGCARAILDRYAAGERDPHALLRSVAATQPWRSSDGCSLLLGMHDGAQVHLLDWSTGSPYEINVVPEQQAVWIGSLGADAALQAWVEDATASTIGNDSAPRQRKLAYFVGALQPLSFVHPSAAVGIGGAFIGAEVGPSGFKWCHDMGYCVVDPIKLLEPGNVDRPKKSFLYSATTPTSTFYATMVGVRDNGLIVSTSTGNSIACISDESVVGSADAWLRKWQRRILNGEVPSGLHGFCAISLRNRTATLSMSIPGYKSLHTLTNSRKRLEFSLSPEMQRAWLSQPKVRASEWAFHIVDPSRESILPKVEIDSSSATESSSAPKRTGRKQPCPCGSGRQYKWCCEGGTT